jgi:NADH:ubiquinone oxidoreductase subunit E
VSNQISTSTLDDAGERLTTTQQKSRPKLRETIRHALESQTAGKERAPSVTVLSSLLAIQDDLHYIPDEAIEETAIFCNATINDVWSVASFYTNFRFSPPGLTTVDVCWGPTCHLMGAQEVLAAVQDELGVNSEETSLDGKITLRYSTCLGACAQAPVIARDHVLTGRTSPDSAREYISDLQQELEDGIAH